jgi:hypothetical protein
MTLLHDSFGKTNLQDSINSYLAKEEENWVPKPQLSNEDVKRLVENIIKSSDPNITKIQFNKFMELGSNNFIEATTFQTNRDKLLNNPKVKQALNITEASQLPQRPNKSPLLTLDTSEDKRFQRIKRTNSRDLGNNDIDVSGILSDGIASFF